MSDDGGGFGPDPGELMRFWEAARVHAGLQRFGVVTGETPLGTVPPPAWAFGVSPEMADELLDLVLTGSKRATASAMEEYEAAGEEPPAPGDVSIILDGAGHPRALVRTTDVRVVPFAEVDADHAAAEGEGDGSLEFWRREHERYLTRTLAEIGRTFGPATPVLLERFELRYPTGMDHATASVRQTKD